MVDRDLRGDRRTGAREIGAAWSSESAGNRRIDWNVSSPLARVRSLSLSLSLFPEMLWSENEGRKSFPGQRWKYWSTGSHFPENIIFHDSQTCGFGGKWFSEVIFTQNKHSLTLFMHHIVFVLYLFVLTCSLPLVLCFSLFFFSLLCVLVLILAPCLWKLEPIGFPLLLLCLLLGVCSFRITVVERLLRNWTVSVRFGLSVLWFLMRLIWPLGLT